MTQQTLTLTVSQELYQNLQNQADVLARPIAEVAVQILAHHTPMPPIEDDLPADLQAELAAMAHLSDELLWQIAESCYNVDKLALYDVLLARHETGELTSEGRVLLSQLREDSERLMLRKAHAYALLSSRGHQLPLLSELTPPAS